MVKGDILQLVEILLAPQWSPQFLLNAMSRISNGAQLSASSKEAQFSNRIGNVSQQVCCPDQQGWQHDQQGVLI